MQARGAGDLCWRLGRYGILRSNAHRVGEFDEMRYQILRLSVVYVLGWR
jgi:hypothetical protein